MKVGNIIGGLIVTDVKRVNKLNLIQFLKEVDSYLHQGYHIDVTSARQVGLVLMVDVYKTEAASSSVGSTDVDSVGGVDSTDVSSTDANSTDVDSVEPDVETVKVEETSLEEPVAEATEQSVESVLTEKQRQEQLTQSVEEAKEALDTFTTPEQNDATVVKKTATRSKKTAQ